MTWQSPDTLPFVEFAHTPSSVGSFRVNDQCFIRKQHKCGKVYGASKSCFIACPSDGDLGTILELISEKLTKVGIEPIIAVKERAYGQDIFCTKICGKIIEGRFCIVILDDAIADGHNIPNPNVYYEYGLMAALRKHIIPLQKQDLELAFNIQSYDTIKYTSRNIGIELDRAIKDAIKITESRDKEEEEPVALSDKTLLWRLEIADLDLRDRHWFLWDVIEDTQFKGFGQYTKKFYVYLGRIDDEADFQNYLEDLDVVFYRTEKKAAELEENVAKLRESKNQLLEEEKIKEERKEPAEIRKRRITTTQSHYNEQRLANIEKKTKEVEGWQELMSTIFVGFVIDPQLDASDFVRHAELIVQKHGRYKLSCSADNAITFGDVNVALGARAD